jgi:hypothetical protein
MTIGEAISDYINDAVKNTLATRELPDVDYIETDNIGELLEKLAILHIRTWMLEDAIQVATSDQEIAELKRKIDICFKQKRPKFVQAINIMLDNAVRNGGGLREDSVKLYKGVNE